MVWFQVFFYQCGLCLERWQFLVIPPNWSGLKWKHSYHSPDRNLDRESGEHVYEEDGIGYAISLLRWLYLQDWQHTMFKTKNIGANIEGGSETAAKLEHPWCLNTLSWFHQFVPLLSFAFLAVAGIKISKIFFWSPGLSGAFFWKNSGNKPIRKLVYCKINQLNIWCFYWY